jgi:1-acyl-sn-glycerol-3-phosphate acyltransferase
VLPEFMLEANKNAWFEKIFTIYNTNLLKRRFDSLQIVNLETLEKRDIETPLLIYANHSCWWDGLVGFQVSQSLKMDSFIMMEERHLQRFQLFRKLGAFSIIREKPFEAIKSINYSVELLKENPQRTLWIFPQGEIIHNDLRPFKFFSGITKIVKKLEKCSIVPLAISYEFGGNFKPTIFVAIGETDFIDNVEKISLKKFENKLSLVLDKLRVDIVNKNFNKFKKLI